MDNGYTPIKRQAKLSSQVAEQIQQLILSRDLKPGDRLPTERELGETFEVSRTVIREAIRTLEARGLVTSQTGSGTYVRAMKGSDVASSLGMYINTRHKPFSLDALMEVRQVLEIEMVRLAADRASQEDISHLENSLRKMCGTTNNAEEFSKWDLEFHLQLCEASGNPLFGIILEPLTESLFELIWTGTSTPGAADEACDFHAQILTHIKNKDSEGAVEVMTRHLEQAYRVTSAGLKNHPSEGE
jgi:GntR family transcriptional repressor for pyruvate dehydrogenase complex